VIIVGFDLAACALNGHLGRCGNRVAAPTTWAGCSRFRCRLRRFADIVATPRGSVYKPPLFTIASICRSDDAIRQV
jgi:hypothetical protein